MATDIQSGMLPPPDNGMAPSPSAPQATTPSQPAPPTMQPQANPAQPSAPAPTPAPAVAAADMAGHSMLGKAVRAIMGQSVEYQPDGRGGVKAVPVKAPPGQLFRHIVAGAILGGAFGHEKEGGDFTSGMARGASGVMEKTQENDREAMKRAQENEKSRMEQQRLDREDQLTKAQIAHYHIMDAQEDAHTDIMMREYLDKTDAANKAMEDLALQSGGNPARIVVQGQDINNKTGNGADIGKAYAQNPRLFDAPDGYRRIHIRSIDYSGLNFDKENHRWVDAEGKPVDLSSRTTHTFYDVPRSSFTSTQIMSGSDVNKLMGFNYFKPDDKVPISAQQAAGLKAENVKQQLEVSKAKHEEAMIGKEALMLKTELARLNAAAAKEQNAEMRGLYETLKTRSDNLKTIITSQQWTDPEESKKAIKELREINDQMGQVYNKIFPNSPLPASEKGGAAPPPAPLVAVIGPNGKPGLIPADRVQEFVKRFPGSYVKDSGKPNPAPTLAEQADAESQAVAPAQ